jgi:protein O-GlcNAc transferase
MSMTPSAEFELAVDHHQAGRIAEAEKLCRQIVAANPGHAEAWHLLGVMALQSANTIAASEYLQRAAVLAPQDAEIHNNLAIALKNSDQFAAALEHFRSATRLTPQSIEFQFNLASALADSGELAEAEPIFRQLLISRPDSAEILFLLGSIYAETGRLTAAVEHFQKSLLLRPNEPETFCRLGTALQGLSRHDEGIACFRQAIALSPNFIDAHNRLGNALRLAGFVDESVTYFRQLVQNRPDHSQSLHNLAVALKDAAQIDEAVDYFRRAVELRPDIATVYGNLLYSIQFSTRYDSAAIFAEHHRFNERHAVTLRPSYRPTARALTPSRRLRIGYVSPYFRIHCQALFLLPLFRHHDRQHFETVCYADDPTDDEVTRELRERSDAWHSIVGLTDEQAAVCIRHDKIDILVNLTMHMSQGRPLLFARKPAPIQVCWLAYPGTTGLTAIDYRLTDPYLDPPGLFDAYYSETSLRLPDTFWCYDPLTNQPPVNDLPARQNGFITFGNLNNPCKTNDAVFDLWAQVLKAVDRSRLMLLIPQAAAAHRLFDAFERRGIATDRILPVEMRSRPQYLELYQQIDIGLDTFPYNGHTTSLDSYWMGVPVITLVGNTVVGRAGLSQLTNLNLADLIAHTPDQFISLARSLAADTNRLSALRASLRQRMQSSPLMDAPRFAKNIEAAYRQMWQCYCTQ